jgi:phosphoadenosine phosphosulfate reductase
MNSLEKKIAVSELIIREAVDGLSRPRINILWSGGKDSTTVLHIVKNMYGEVPFTVTFADCTLEFPEVYTFIEKVTKLWKLRLEKLTYASPEALRKFDETGRKDRKILVREKAKASKAYIKERNIQLSLSGIRWYEHFHKINRFKGNMPASI